MPSSVLSGQLVSKTPAGSSKQLMSPRRIAAAPILRANARCNDLVDRLPAYWSTAAPSFDLVLDKLCFGHRDKMSGCVGHRSKLSEPQKKNDGRVGKCALSRAVNEPSKPSRARINLGKNWAFFHRTLSKFENTCEQKFISSDSTCAKTCLSGSNGILFLAVPVR